MTEDLKKLKDREVKVEELEKNVIKLLNEINIDLPSHYKIVLLHPIEYVFIKFLREELIHGEIDSLSVSNGLPRWGKYKVENGVIKRVKFDDSSSLKE